METKTILCSQENEIATLTLNRPEVRNAVSPEMHQELRQALQRYDADQSIRVIVITGSGQTFSAGGDIASMRARIEAKMTAEAYIERYHTTFIPTIIQIREVRKPIIAKINGAALGAGTNLALACDIRIASSKAIFGELFTKRGLIPDWGGTYFLPRVVGMAKACELCFTGKVIDAEKALAIGLVDYVVDPEELDFKVEELAREICINSPMAVRMTKEALYSNAHQKLPEALLLEAYGQSICITSEDHREGIHAFLEKRPAQFKG